MKFKSKRKIKLKFKYLTLEETIIKEIKEHEEEFISKCNNK